MYTMKGVPVLKTGENKIVAWRDGKQVEVGDPDCIGIQYTPYFAPNETRSFVLNRTNTL